MERLGGELQEFRDKCEELRETKQDAVRELLHFQDQHREELQLIRTDLQEEIASREGLERRLNELRGEVSNGRNL